MNLIYALEYLRQDYALVAVVGPWAFTIFWCLWAGRRTLPDLEVGWVWMLTVIASYLLSAWEVTETTRSLHIINVFLVYVCFYMFTGKDLNVGWAYVMSFLCLWTVDMVRSYELVLAHEEGPNTFYYGVGGAGLNDGLVIFPFMTVLIIYYARWRIKMTRRLSA